MNRMVMWIPLALLAALGGGYLLGQRHAPPPLAVAPAPDPHAGHAAPAPAPDPHAGHTAATASAPNAGYTPPALPSEPRKILYYRNPMGLPDISKEPKKDSMGMDYVPVYADEAREEEAASLSISRDKVQKLGVKSEAAALRPLTRAIRAVGTVQVDESRVHVVAPKFEGYIEVLHADTSGQTVQKGASLMEVYSPDLVLAQQEYLGARQAAKALEQTPEASGEARQAAHHLAEGALQRLRNWDISPAQIQRLQNQGLSSRTLSLPAPVSGIVLEKHALAGMRFMPGEALYHLADLSQVWVVAEVFEQDLGQVRVGQEVHVNFTALPGKHFTGKVTFIYPTLSEETRTGKIRVELPNPERLLKPSLYAAVEILSPMAEQEVLTVSDSAVLDSGLRQVVLLERGEGRYEPRAVKTGARAGGWVEIREGLQIGEKVVVRANFLIDAESNLRAALQGFSAP